LIQFLTVLVAIGFSERTARSDDTATIEELKSRVEAVEKQNRILQQALSEKMPAGSASDSKPVLQTGATDDAGEPDDEHIRTVVRDYLASQSKEKSTAAGEPEWYDVGSDATFHAIWKNGVEFETKNKDFRMKFRGRTQLDFATFDVPNNVNADPSLVNPIRNGVDFRRARLGVEGLMFEQIE